MKKKMKKKPGRKQRYLSKKGAMTAALGVSGAAALGMIFSGPANAQYKLDRFKTGDTFLDSAAKESKDTAVQSYKYTAPSIQIAEPITLKSQDFLDSFQINIKEDEAIEWEDIKVQQAYAILSRLPISQQVEFLTNPDLYVENNEWFADFGIVPGSFIEDGQQNPQIGVMVKKLRTTIINKFTGITAAYNW